MYRIFQWKNDERHDEDDRAIAMLDKALRSDSGLAKAFFGFVGFAQDGLARALLGFLVGAAVVAVCVPLGCSYLVIGHHLGFQNVRDLGLPSLAIVAAHGATAVALILCSQFWRWPAAIKRRGELFKQDRKNAQRIADIQQRLAERGAYKDSGNTFRAPQE